MKKWSEVAETPEYKALDSAAQESARTQYFDQVVAPQVPDTEKDLAKKQFFADTAPKRRATDYVSEAVGSIAEPMAAMASGMVAKPVSDVAGLTSLGMEGARRAGLSFIPERNPLAVQRDVQNAFTYQPRTQAGQAVTEYNPLALFGKGVNWLGQQAEAGINQIPMNVPLRNALGYGVHEAVNQAPMFAGLKAPEAAAATSSGLESLATGRMQSALKPPAKATLSGDTAKAIQTMFDEGINVTKGGVEKLKALRDDLNDRISNAIEASTATIDKSAVAERLRPAFDKFALQVNEASDLASIQKAWDGFMSHSLLEGNKVPKRVDQERPAIEQTIRETAANQPGPAIANVLEQVAGETPGRFSDLRQIQVPPPEPRIPIQLAQKIKQGTYKSVGDKAYGELKSSDIEAQKALARGLKEEIAGAAPEIGPLNAQEGAILNALKLVERRVALAGNKELMGLGWIPSSVAKTLAYMAERNEAFKSVLGRMLHAGGKGVPTMDVAGPVAGAITTQRADQQKALVQP